MSRSFRISPALVVAVVVASLALPQTAAAYVGPGAGITVVGAALALVASVFLAIVGFIWYPIKKLVRAIGLRAGRARRGPTAD